MKLASASTLVAAIAIAAISIGAQNTAAAADVSVVGAKDATPTMRGADVKVATADVLNRPTGLINKNSVVMDNNIFVARSNVALAQNDRVALAKRVEQLVTTAASDSASTAVLSRNVLKAVSGRDTDAATMSKVSAVVAAKDDASMRGQRIADLVNTVFDAKQQEQVVQSAAPRGVVILAGSKDILRQPTAVVNKNIAVSDTQVAVSRSTIAPSQNDNVALSGNAKVATLVAPASSIRVSADATADRAGSAADNYRMGFLFAKDMAKKSVENPKDSASGAIAADKSAMAATEQFGLWGGGWGFGWRYPLGYWNTFGAGLYGGGCGLGLAFGPYFYC